MSHVFDVTTAKFQEQVLDRSEKTPVIVDFWAPWCGPCRQLGPALESAVAALGGKVLLAKVNTDQEPELAARHQISGIPAVKAFVNGQVVDEFVGARPASFVKEFLARLAPSEVTQALRAIAQALQDGDPAAAAQRARARS